MRITPFRFLFNFFPTHIFVYVVMGHEVCTDSTYGTSSLTPMNSLYTPGDAASLDAAVSELNCHSQNLILNNINLIF